MPAPTVPQAVYQAALQVAFGAARSAAERHRAELTADPNVIDVRPGYKFQGGWITDTPAVVVTVDRPPCGSGTSNVTVQGTTLEQPPSQPNGGGFNSSMSAGTVTLATPLANGASIDVRFLLGIQQTGSFKFYLNVEALP